MWPIRPISFICHCDGSRSIVGDIAISVSSKDKFFIRCSLTCFVKLSRNQKWFSLAIQFPCNKNMSWQGCIGFWYIFFSLCYRNIRKAVAHRSSNIHIFTDIIVRSRQPSYMKVQWRWSVWWGWVGPLPWLGGLWVICKHYQSCYHHHVLKLYDIF